MIVIVKIGTSSLTTVEGNVDRHAIDKLCSEVAQARTLGHSIVIVTSGAITAGLRALGPVPVNRQRDPVLLQAAAAVGQSRLLRSYDEALAPHRLIAGQILLSPNNFFDRKHYLNARNALQRLLKFGVVPIVNENDAVTDDELRFGDNDRIAALVAHALSADTLLLLTDTAGLFTADPRIDSTASLVEEVVEVDQELQDGAGQATSDRGSGGMAAKLTAARMAAHSGVKTIIAEARRPDVVIEAIMGSSNVGTTIHARTPRLSARKVWIAFAVRATGRIVVDAGAQQALVAHQRSLLAAGVQSVEGSFDADDGVEIADNNGTVFAKGLSRYTSSQLNANAGRRSTDLIGDVPAEVIHRDDLVILN